MCYTRMPVRKEFLDPRLHTWTWLSHHVTTWCDNQRQNFWTLTCTPERVHHIKLYACRHRNSESSLALLNVSITSRYMPVETEFLNAHLHTWTCSSHQVICLQTQKFWKLTCTPERVYHVTLYACRDRNSESSLAHLNVFITSSYMPADTEILKAHLHSWTCLSCHVICL